MYFRALLITILNITLLLFAYLIGSLPFSILAGKLLKGIDIREYGSGNAGATNTFRVLGKKAGIPVLVLDILKGYAAVSLAFFCGYEPHTEMYINFSLAYGIAAVLGHVFPIYVGFRGGKGVATLLGMMIAVFPFAALLSIGIFIITLFFSRYVSLSSILAGVFFSHWCLFFVKSIGSLQWLYSPFLFPFY